MPGRHLAEVLVTEIKRKVRPNLLLKHLPLSMRCRRCGSRQRIRVIVGAALGHDNPMLSVP